MSTHSDNQKITCYNCGSTVQGSILQYVKDKCPGKSTKCYKWEKTGYFVWHFVPHFAHFKKYKKCKRNQDSEKTTGRTNRPRRNLYQFAQTYFSQIAQYKWFQCGKFLLIINLIKW